MESPVEIRARTEEEGPPVPPARPRGQVTAEPQVFPAGATAPTPSCTAADRASHQIGP